MGAATTVDDAELESGLRRTWNVLAAACVSAASLAAARPLAAQSAEPPEHKTFYSGKDAAIGAGFLAASAGLSIFDARLAHFFQDSMHLHVRVGRRVDNFFTHINETTLTAGGLAVYAVARLTGQHHVANAAFHVSESVFAASVTSQLIRGPLGRTRPRDADKPFENQYDFRFMQGFGHFQQRAFPSIHSSSGFAAASAIVAEVHHRSPGATWFVAVPAYAVAMTPGLSRMYLGQHWASDIFAGAVLGTFYGWRVVNYSYSHTTTPVDRVFLGKTDRTRTGIPVGWSVTF
ncbi:MAG: phosphoesterase PA-phosphatase related protein [Gemmatimonadetes bacterium]|nr:phosphoesterase PA-phosphatase related protein [Gemmatimonadota bacterium]